MLRFKKVFVEVQKKILWNVGIDKGSCLNIYRIIKVQVLYCSQYVL